MESGTIIPIQWHQDTAETIIVVVRQIKTYYITNENNNARLWHTSRGNFIFHLHLIQFLNS